MSSPVPDPPLISADTVARALQERFLANASRGDISDPTASTTPTPKTDAPLGLSTRTLAWLADHPQARQFVGSVWDKLTELERSGQHPGAIDALRRVLTQHQPTPTGRCRTCRRVTGRRRPFPCIIWHQIRSDLLGLFTSTSRRHQTSPWKPNRG